MHVQGALATTAPTLCLQGSTCLQEKVRHGHEPKRVYLDLVRGDPLGGASPGARSPACVAAVNVRVRVLETALEAKEKEARPQKKPPAVGFCRHS